MFEIAKNVVSRIDKNATFDEIKAELKAECEKATFEITDKDFNEMFAAIIVTFMNI